MISTVALFVCLFSRVIFNFYKLFTGKVSHYAQLPENKERDAFDFKMNLERKSYVATEKKLIYILVQQICPTHEIIQLWLKEKTTDREICLSTY